MDEPARLPEQTATDTMMRALSEFGDDVGDSSQKDLEKYMKVKRLELRNFRNHDHSVLNLDGTTFAILRGCNGAGKSSLIQALSIALSETTMGLAIDGKGYQSKIKGGEKEAKIVATIQGQHVIEKTVTLSLGASGRTQVIKCLDAPDDKKIVNGFENFLSRYRDALRIATNTDAFVRLDEKEQKNLLAKLVLPSRYDFPRDKQAAVHEVLGANQIDFEGEPFAVIEAAYKRLYKEREAINRQVKEFAIPPALPIPTGIDSESLQKELLGLREQRANLQVDRDAAVASAHKEEVERTKLSTSLTNLRARLDEGKKKLAAIDAIVLSDEVKGKLEKIAGNSETLANLRQQHTALRGGMSAVNDQIKRLRDVADQGATCPTCDQAIDGEKIAALIAELKAEEDQADAKLQGIDKQIEALGDIEVAKESLKKHTQAQKEREELVKSLTEIVDEGKKVRASIDALGEKKDTTLPFNDPLGTLQAKEDKIVELMRPVIAAEERAKDIKEKTEAFEKLETKAKTLQELTVYFDKGGIKATLIKDHIGSFENKIQSVLSRFGYKAMLGPDMEFKVETKRGYIGPIVELSKAERQLFYPAFQCAVSIAAGIKMVVIDDMDTYLKEDGLRNEMYISVYGLVADGSLEQAILIEASTDKTVPEKKAAGAKYFFVTDGTVEVLG